MQDKRQQKQCCVLHKVGLLPGVGWGTRSGGGGEGLALLARSAKKLANFKLHMRQIF
jgi:hypothetical protein